MYKENMNVLFVTHYPDLYGANLSLCNVATELKKTYGAKVFVLCLSSSGTALKEYLSREKIDVKFLRFYNTTYPIGNAKKHIKAYVASWLNEIKVMRLHDFIMNNQINLIHTNTMATLVGAQLARRYRIPHIWHLREFLEEDYACSQVNNIVFRRVSEYTDQFIAISNSVKSKYVSKLGERKIKVIYNGIPQLNHVENKLIQNEKTRNKKVFGIVGVIRKEKGTLEAIKAFLDIKHDTFPDCELWVIGGGMEKQNDEYINEIQRVVKKSLYGHKVKFLGYRRDVTELLDHIDIGLVCSKLEAFGRITIEYMMKEVLVIGANSGGTSELVNDCVTGRLYKVGDISDLTNKMTECLDGTLDIEMLKRNAKIFSQDFTIEKCVNNIYKTYKNILKV